MDVKKGLDASNSSAIERVVKWATEEALHKVKASTLGRNINRETLGNPSQEATHARRGGLGTHGHHLSQSLMKTSLLV